MILIKQHAPTCVDHSIRKGQVWYFTLKALF